MDKYRLFDQNNAPLKHSKPAHVSRYAKADDSSDIPPEEAEEIQLEGYFVSELTPKPAQVTPEAMEKIAQYFSEQPIASTETTEQSQAAARTAALQTRLRHSRRVNKGSRADYTETAVAPKSQSHGKRTNIAKADFMQARSQSQPYSTRQSNSTTSEEVDLMVSIPGQIYTPGHEQHLHHRAQASYQRTHGKRKTYVPDEEAQLLIKKHRKNPHVKTIVTAVATLTGLYLIFGPMIPGILRQFASGIDKSGKNQAQADQKEISDNGLKPVAQAPKEHAVGEIGWLKIPVIGVSAPIVEGKDDNAMTYGIWHRPGTSTPLTDSNTVLAGHRYEYINGPKTFYSLDKVKVGDTIEVKWNEQIFRYKVVRTFVVARDKMYIEAPTTVPLLTIYTCTPLWTSINRLVVQATPV